MAAYDIPMANMVAPQEADSNLITKNLDPVTPMLVKPMGDVNVAAKMSEGLADQTKDQKNQVALNESVTQQRDKQWLIGGGFDLTTTEGIQDAIKSGKGILDPLTLQGLKANQDAMELSHAQAVKAMAGADKDKTDADIKAAESLSDAADGITSKYYDDIKNKDPNAMTNFQAGKDLFLKMHPNIPHIDQLAKATPDAFDSLARASKNYVTRQKTLLDEANKTKIYQDPNDGTTYSVNESTKTATRQNPDGTEVSIPLTQVPTTVKEIGHAGSAGGGTMYQDPSSGQKYMISKDQTEAWISDDSGNWTPIPPNSIPKEVMKMGASQRNSNVSLLDENGIDYVAQDYRRNGSSVLSRFSATDKAKVINKASELALAAGNTSEAESLRRFSIHANQIALNGLTKQEQLVDAYEKTADKQLNLLVELGRKVPKADWPFINSALMKGEKTIAGSPEANNFLSSAIATQGEFAKILSGSTSAAGATDASRREAADMISPYMSEEQLESLVPNLKREMEFRRQGYAEQKAELVKGSVQPKNAPASSPKKDITSDPAAISIGEDLKAGKITPDDAKVKLKALGYL